MTLHVCDRCGKDVAMKTFLHFVYYGPVGDKQDGPDMLSEQELCAECIDDIKALINTSKEQK